MFEYIYEKGCYEERFDHIPLCFATQSYINETGDSVGEVIQLEFEILKRTIEDFIDEPNTKTNGTTIIKTASLLSWLLNK